MYLKHLLKTMSCLPVCQLVDPSMNVSEIYMSDHEFLYSVLCLCMVNIQVCHLLWPPCVADADIIFLPCGFFFFFLLLLLFFPRLISAVAHWMSTILPHMLWP